MDLVQLIEHILLQFLSYVSHCCTVTPNGVTEYDYRWFNVVLLWISAYETNCSETSHTLTNFRSTKFISKFRPLIWSILFSPQYVDHDIQAIYSYLSFSIIDGYRQTSNIITTLGGNKLVDLSDVVGVSPVGAAPNTSHSRLNSCV